MRASSLNFRAIVVALLCLVIRQSSASLEKDNKLYHAAFTYRSEADCTKLSGKIHRVTTFALNASGFDMVDLTDEKWEGFMVEGLQNWTDENAADLKALEIGEDEDVENLNHGNTGPAFNTTSVVASNQRRLADICPLCWANPGWNQHYCESQGCGRTNERRAQRGLRGLKSTVRSGYIDESELITMKKAEEWTAKFLNHWRHKPVKCLYSEPFDETKHYLDFQYVNTTLFNFYYQVQVILVEASRVEGKTDEEIEAIVKEIVDQKEDAKKIVTEEDVDKIVDGITDEQDGGGN